MPPELKKPINSIAEIICNNCIFTDKHWQKGTVECRLELLNGIDNFCRISSEEFFCSKGQWIIMLDNKKNALPGEFRGSI